VPRYSLWRPMVTSRRVCPLPSVRGMVLGPHLAFVAVAGGEGPCGGLRPCQRLTLQSLGRARRNPLQGSSGTDPTPLGSNEVEPFLRGRKWPDPHPRGQARQGPCPRGRARRSPCPWGRARRELRSKGRTKPWSHL
jgi:hypothetical protein